MIVVATISAVLALFTFVSAFCMIVRNHRKREARRKEQSEWNSVFARLEEEECARAAEANRNFDWRG